VFRFFPVAFYLNSKWCTEIQCSPRSTCAASSFSEGTEDSFYRLRTKKLEHIKKICLLQDQHVMLSLWFETILEHTTKMCSVHDNSYVQLLSTFLLYTTTHESGIFYRTQLYRSILWLHAGIVTLSSSVARGTLISYRTSCQGTTGRNKNGTNRTRQARRDHSRTGYEDRTSEDRTVRTGQDTTEQNRAELRNVLC